MENLIEKKAISLALLAKRRGCDYKANYAKQHQACRVAFPNYKIIRKMSIERPYCQMLARSGPLYWAWLFAYQAQAALIVNSLDQLGNDYQSLDILRDQTDVPILVANLGQNLKDLPDSAFLYLAKESLLHEPKANN